MHICYYLCLILILAGCWRNNKSVPAKNPLVIKIEKFAMEHNAIRLDNFYEDSIKTKYGPRLIYAIDVEEYFLHRNSPVLITGEVINIFKRNDSYFIDINYFQNTGIYFILKASKEYADYLRQFPSYSFVFIANLYGVQASILDLGTEPIEDDEGGYSGCKYTFSSPKTNFIRGELVTAMYVGP